MTALPSSWSEVPDDKKEKIKKIIGKYLELKRFRDKIEKEVQEIHDGSD